MVERKRDANRAISVGRDSYLGRHNPGSLTWGIIVCATSTIGI